MEKLKDEKNAVIVAHHYAPPEIHDVCDVLSDSRGVFEAVKRGFDEDIVIAVAPYFFVEILSAMLPDKTVVTPVMSECPVSNHPFLSFERISEFKEKHPEIPLVCYTTSPFKIKVLVDALCFPGEVVKTIESMDSDVVLFVGERNCTQEAIMKCSKRIIPYPHNPVCNVYNSATLSDVKRMKETYPDACLIVHPECRREVLEVADYICGSGMVFDIIKKTDYPAYILGFEEGFCRRVAREFPDKTVVHLCPYLICNAFKVFRLETILDSLTKGGVVVRVDETLRNRIAPLLEKL
ncbi:quinolinate synthase NadA [Archaeoglobus sp.]